MLRSRRVGECLQTRPICDDSIDPVYETGSQSHNGWRVKTLRGIDPQIDSMALLFLEFDMATWVYRIFDILRYGKPIDKR